MGGLISYPDFKNYPAPLHFLEIMDSRIGKVTVGENQLFAREGLDSCSLQSNIFDHPILVIDYHKVSHFKRFVKKYHEVIEDISHYILGGERYSNISNTQTGDDSCNIHSPI